MDPRLHVGNIYLDQLELEIMDIIRRNEPEEGSKLIAYIGERDNMRSRLYEISNGIY